MLSRPRRRLPGRTCGCNSRCPVQTGRCWIRFISDAGGSEAFGNTGCLPAAGFLGPSLYWLGLQEALPELPVTACFIPDAVVSFLTGATAVCEPTLAASSGIFDIRANRWDSTLLERLKLPARLFPPVGRAGDVVGGLRPEVAEAIGLAAGTPVTVALGDNQASFIGSAPEPARSLLLNVGTGGQISARTDSFYFIPGLENRPFPGGQYLLIGGRTVRRSFLCLLAALLPAGGHPTSRNGNAS